MKKRFVIITALITAFALCAPGCSVKQPPDTQPSDMRQPDTQPSDTQPSDTQPPIETGHPTTNTGTPLETWEAVRGSFVREGSGQYDNAVLSMMYLDNSCLMFELRLMEGSESEDSAHDIVIPGVLIVDDEGVGLFETLTDAANPFEISFTLSEDGGQITVTHSGILEISPDGKYVFIDDGLEVSNLSAKEILEFLPTAATSLNSNLGAHTVNYPDTLVADWFYLVEAVFDDTGAVLAKFAIAKDLSAVFRVDDDIEPVLIFGSAQPMMDAETYVYQESDDEGEPGENEVFAEAYFDARPIVDVGIEDGVTIPSGSSSRLAVSLPWELPYSLTAESSDEAVATVNEDGVITAITAGETVISGTLSAADGLKNFFIEVSVADGSLGTEEVTN